MTDDLDHAIAIVGMAARLPGATTPAEFWRNLTDGVESITTLTDEELLAAGVRREALLRPGYVRRAAVLDRMDWFDAEFFGFSPKDAAIMAELNKEGFGPEDIVRAIEHFADYLPKAFSTERFAFYGTALQGTPEQ
ncbi:MAG: beta-ketoacyl synthase N-terminal-like domain-containing protein, partial [Ilumatobacteraceae bacterium]